MKGLSVGGGLANSSDRGCFDAFVVFGRARVEGGVGFRNRGPAIEFESCCEALRSGCFLSNVSSVPFVTEVLRLLVFLTAAFASDAFLTRAAASPEVAGADISLSIPSSATIGGETSADFAGGVEFDVML